VVVLPLDRARVERVAVELDRDPLVEEDRIDLHPQHLGVDRRPREPEARAQVGKALLLRAPHGRRVRPRGEQPFQRRATTMPRMADEQRLDGRPIEPLQDVCLRDRPPQVARRKHGGEVESGARDRRDRDPVVLDDLVRRDLRMTVHRDAAVRRTPRLRDHHLDRRRRRRS
jgi:hypothetical protein